MGFSPVQGSINGNTKQEKRRTSERGKTVEPCVRCKRGLCGLRLRATPDKHVHILIPASKDERNRIA